jgi:ATP-dependent Clp protease ATP-binding subunit ClpX
MMSDVEGGRRKVFELPSGLNERSLYDVLDQAVVGQVSAKRKLASLFALHIMGSRNQKLDVQLPNAILIGPTGVGKTYSMRTAAAAIGLPFVSIDSTSFVPAGVVGNQIEDVMLALWKESEELLRRSGFRCEPEDIRRLAQSGVIFLDEFDKIATPSRRENPEDASRRLVQRRLLKCVDGDLVKVGVPYRDYGDLTMPSGEVLDTTNMLFLAGGAFSDIEEYKGRRRNGELYRRLFGPDAVVPEDIRSYGFITELVARFPILIQFENLKQRELAEILRSSRRSPLRIWEEYARVLNVELEVDDNAIDLFAVRASTLGNGARGLQELVFPYFAERFSSALEANFPAIKIRESDLRFEGFLYKQGEEPPASD